jgi:hypothetical protein
MDTVVYVRFLRGCVLWVLLQTVTTAPILLAVHLTFAKGASRADMNSASLSYLVVECDPNQADRDLITCDRVTNEKGRRLLWIHLCLLWYIALSWFYTLWWIGHGSLRIRARWIRELRSRREKANKDTPVDGTEPPTARLTEDAFNLPSDSQDDDSLGWRQRTLLVTNLPPTMRDEASVRRYFEEFLRPDDGTPMSSVDDLHRGETTVSQAESNNTSKGSAEGQSLEAASTLAAVTESSGDTRYKHWEAGKADQVPYVNREASGPEPDRRPHRHLRSPVQTVVLVRKMNELSAMLNRRQEVLGQLEAAHIKLAKSVLGKVAQQTRKMQDSSKDDDEKKPWWKVSKLMRSKGGKEDNLASNDADKEAANQLREDTLKLNELTVRLQKYVGVSNDTQWPGYQGDNIDAAKESVWEALADVPRDLLDPYQPVTRLSSLFRGQKVPTIDYLLTKLNLLTALVIEMRARPPTSYEPTSTAFVTFRDPRQARMVWRELKSQIVVKVRLAPEVKDLDWDRLMRTTFTGDIVRGIGVNTFFWIATILWVVPVSLLCTSLFSVSKLEGLFPSVRDFFKNNPNFEGFVGNTLPTLIVSLLTMSVPELIFQISKRAQGFVTFSTLYDECLCRYWKFVICNVLIFFCVGATTVESIILQAGKDSSILDSIAFAFPTAAPFYIAYLILGMALHTGFELLGFMVPLIQHLGARKAATPRIRALKTLPRNFNRYYWLPFHVLILTIVFVFALLNPLIIPFALVYLFVAFVVFKKNLAYTYFRRFNEMEGAVYFVRILRFSLDGLLVGEIVLLIFFSVTKQSAVYIALTAVLLPINVLVKLLGTRLWKSQCRALEDEEGNALCGIGSSEASINQKDHIGKHSLYGRSSDEEQLEYTTPLDARASGRYPPVVVAPQTLSGVLLLWNHIHNLFNANGNDRPSYIVSAQARGSHLSAKVVINAVASAPKGVPKAIAEKPRHLSFAMRTASNRGKDDGEAGMQEMQDALPISTKAFKESLEQGQDEAAKKKAKTYRQMSLRRSRSIRSTRSIRSEEAPFLSGIDAIANHAPVSSQDLYDGEDYEDGETSRAVTLHRRTTRDRRVPRSSSYSTTLVKGRPTLESINGGYLTTPQETDESYLNQGTEHSIWREEEHEMEAKKQVENIEEEEEEEEDDEYEDDDEEEALVKPHGKIRWDDTPNNSARYNNPFYSVELDPFLWLPRDPTKPLDLCDTVEWHGAALVSSQGGMGKVGEWDEEQENDLEDQDHGYDGQGSDAEHGSLRGDETIDVLGPLAQRLQEADDLEESVDPATSISRDQMEHYKKALDQAEKHRRFSMRSTSTHSNRHSAGSETHMLGLSQYAAHDSAIQEQSENEESMAVNDPAHIGGQTIESPLPMSGGTVPPGSADSRKAQASKQREPSHAASTRIGESAAETATVAGHDLSTPHKRRISMRKALQAEVLEEEYRRTIKSKLIERKKREKSEHHADVKARPSTAKENDMEMHDLEAQTEKVEEAATDSAIMTRHEHRMHRQQPAESLSRRDGSVGNSVRAAMSSAFMPRRSDGNKDTSQHLT